MRAAQGQLFLTAARSPGDWHIDIPDLKSRLKSAMIVTIDPPDDGMLASVAVKLFSDRQVVVGEDVIAYLVNRGERSFEGLARAVDALDRAALAAKRPITSVLAREILAGTEQYDETNEV
jgi:chromosomal replication initiation ATPase DnaA